VARGVMRGSPRLRSTRWISSMHCERRARCVQFGPDPVPPEMVVRLLDTARFAPSGGNRQAWRVVVVRDGDVRPVSGTSISRGGTRTWPWGRPDSFPGPRSPTGPPRRAPSRVPPRGWPPPRPSGPGGFAEHLDEVPVLLVVLTDLRALAAVDRDLDRYTLRRWGIDLSVRLEHPAGGAGEGLAGVMTTMATRHEDDVRALLGVPDHLAVAAVVALGWPVHQPTKLRRRARWATSPRWTVSTVRP
jgi:nitroreductase